MTNTKSTKRAIVSSVMALFLCFAMLLGTTYAWFTDSVKSENNIIQTGKLKIGLVWADGATDPANTTWNEASVKIFNYDKWEPGYAAARHFKVTNNGTLAFNYKMRIVADGIVTKLADVIDVYYVEEDAAVERADIANAEYLGTLAEVLGTEKSLSNTICGSLVAGADAHIHTVVFKMKEEADDKYQDMDLGCTFTIELIATQMASEKDSFGPDYDAIVSVPETPEALVTTDNNVAITYTRGIGGAVEEGTLKKAFQFQPTMSYEEALQSEWKLWHADFVVYADNDVSAESVMLAGYYKEWCQYNNDNWVGLIPDTDIPANTQIRLVEYLGTTVNWRDLCKYGNDGIGFKCGAADLTGENAGTTLTVELRLYKVGEQGDCATGGGCTHPYVDCETSEDDYIVAGLFTFTF